jgi:SET domain-containing protein
MIYFFLYSLFAFFQDIHKLTTRDQQRHLPVIFYIQHSDNHNTYVYDANIKQELLIRLNLLAHTEWFILKMV